MKYLFSLLFLVVAVVLFVFFYVYQNDDQAIADHSGELTREHALLPGSEAIVLANTELGAEVQQDCELEYESDLYCLTARLSSDSNAQGSLSHVFIGLANYSEEMRAEESGRFSNTDENAEHTSSEQLWQADIIEWLELPVHQISPHEYRLMAQNVPSADVYHLIALDSALQSYSASVQATSSHRIDFGLVQGLLSGSFQFRANGQLAQLFNNADSRLGSLDVRLVPGQLSPQWLWLQALYFPLEHYTDLNAASLQRQNIWWTEQSISSLFAQEWGPLPSYHELTLEVSRRGELQSEPLHYEIKPGQQTLEINLDAMLSAQAAQIDLKVQLLDAVTKNVLPDWQVLKLPIHQTLCAASDAQGSCLLADIETSSSTEFALSPLPTMEEIAEATALQELPTYPRQVQQKFEPLDYAEVLLSGQSELTLTWLVPRLHWLRIDADNTLRFQAMANQTLSASLANSFVESYPVYRLERLLDDGAWQVASSEHFITLDNDELWVSVENDGDYRLVVALDSVHLLASESKHVSLTTTNDIAQTLIFSLTTQGDWLNRSQSLVPALTELAERYGVQQGVAIYCADYPFPPLILSLQRAITANLDSSGCDTLQFELQQEEADPLLLSLDMIEGQWLEP